MNATHGSPKNDEKSRHVGDLGNIIADANGVVKINISDNALLTNYTKSLAGLSVVIHEGMDDLGTGLSPSSRTSGNGGIKMACGNVSSEIAKTFSTLLIASLLFMTL